MIVNRQHCINEKNKGNINKLLGFIVKQLFSVIVQFPKSEVKIPNIEFSKGSVTEKRKLTTTE